MIMIGAFAAGSVLAVFFGYRILRDIHLRLENLEEKKRSDTVENDIYSTSDIYNVENLKDCPFCGSDDVIYAGIFADREVVGFEVWCGGCQIVFSCGDSTKEEISRLWNRRDEK